MKKTIVLITCLTAFSFISCKKDRMCECTRTYTSTSGATTTYPAETITYRKIKKSDAKDLCQKRTEVYVNSDGKTSTNVLDCKLK
jgi:hypothetical protein